MENTTPQMTEVEVNRLIEAKLTNFNYLAGPIRLISGYIRSNNFQTDPTSGEAIAGWSINADGTTQGISTYAFGTTTFNSTTTTTITCGFPATVVFVLATGANANNGGTQSSMGMGDGTTQRATYFTSDAGAGSASAVSTTAAWVIGYGGNITSNQSGVVNNFTSTTFDLANTFTNGGNTPTANIMWVAIQ